MPSLYYESVWTPEWGALRQAWERYYRDRGVSLDRVYTLACAKANKRLAVPTHG